MACDNYGLNGKVLNVLIDTHSQSIQLNKPKKKTDHWREKIPNNPKMTTMKKCMIYLMAFILAIFMERITKATRAKIEINTIEPGIEIKEGKEPWLNLNKAYENHAKYNRIARFESTIPIQMALVNTTSLFS